MCQYVNTSLFPLANHPIKTLGGGVAVLHSTSEDTEAQRGERQTWGATHQDSKASLISFHSQRLLSLRVTSEFSFDKLK